MRNNFSHLRFFVIAMCSVVVTGGASTLTACQTIKSGNLNRLSICEIRKNRAAYLGANINLSLIYSFDGGSHEMLIDETCKGQNILNITTKLGGGDSSVRNFFDTYAARCQASKKEELCRSKAKIDAEVAIVQNEDGTLAGNIEKIFNFSFIE